MCVGARCSKGWSYKNPSCVQWTFLKNKVPGFSGHWHSPPGCISGDRCNLRIYKVELQVQTTRCGIVFSVAGCVFFYQRWVLENFFQQNAKVIFPLEKNNHLPFPREKVTFFYEKETFCPEASGGSFLDCLTSLHKTRAGCCALAEMTFYSLFRVANSKKYKTAFSVVILRFSYWCVQPHY